VAFPQDLVVDPLAVVEVVEAVGKLTA